MPVTQTDRPLKLQTALGADALILTELTGAEALSTPFSFELELVSENAEVDGKSLIGTGVTLQLRMPDGTYRPIHGRVRRFVRRGRGTLLTSYGMEVVPWLWFLSLSSESRIYQNLSVPDIVEKVFKEHGFNDFRLQLTGSYPAREYCVQYRETHLDFVARLLEDEGIFYYFEHEEGKHTLVLVDSNSPLQAVSGNSTLTVRQDSSGADEVIHHFEQEFAAHTNAVMLRDYDFTKPAFDLSATVTGAEAKPEAYDYPGGFSERDVGSQYARKRLEAAEALEQVFRGAGGVVSMQSGQRFTVAGHYASALDQEYLITEVRHAATGGQLQAGLVEEPLEYRNEFVCIPSSVPYRPPARTPRPVVRGSHTAVVVGPASEEIYTDEYGRIKVRFHWDRESNGENSSCWIRVATTWAGKQWGAIHIPRINQEVVVDFLEGDPDRPLVTGSVYNDAFKPPYALPDNKTQSGIKSRSTLKGEPANFNEIRFEDKKGSEEIHVQAEKDLTTLVKNDETREVQNNRTTTIKQDEKQTVTDGNEILEVSKGNQTLTIGQGNQTIEIKQGNQKTTLGMGNQETELKQGNQTTTLDVGNQEIKLSVGNRTIKLDAGKSTEEAMQSIELKVGQSSIKLDQSGVTIKGMNLKIEGMIQVEVKGVMTTIKGDAMLTAKGGITMIN